MAVIMSTISCTTSTLLPSSAPWTRRPIPSSCGNPPTASPLAGAGGAGGAPRAGRAAAPPRPLVLRAPPDRVAARRGGGVEVLPLREQPGRIHEARQLEPPDLLGGRLLLAARHAHHAGARDADARRVVGHADGGLHHVPLAGDEHALVADLEASVARV